MQAIIKTGGKQYKVSEGQFIRIEKVQGEAGDKISFDEVLLISDGANTQIGAPKVDEAKVFGEIQFHARAEKIRIIKFKRRKHHLKRQGHRQHFTQVKITAIETTKSSSTKPKAEAKTKAATSKATKTPTSTKK